MATEQRLIDAGPVIEKLKSHHDLLVDAWGGFGNLPEKDKARVDEITNCMADIFNAPTIEARPVVHGYTAHEVAEILADAFGDACACNFNGNDEWLPEMCELQDACPNPVGVACWEQWLKHRTTKMDGGTDETV